MRFLFTYDVGHGCRFTIFRRSEVVAMCLQQQTVPTAEVAVNAYGLGTVLYYNAALWTAAVVGLSIISLTPPPSILASPAPQGVAKCGHQCGVHRRRFLEPDVGRCLFFLKFWPVLRA